MALEAILKFTVWFSPTTKKSSLWELWLW